MKLYRSIKINWKAFLAAAAFMAAVFAAIFTVSAAVTGESVKVPVVMYHALLQDEKRHGKYVISPAEFETDLIWLEKHGYTTILVSDLIVYTQGFPLPEKPILLTFDDGYYNNYLYAFEIAKKHGAKFVISPVASLSDQYTQTGETNGYYTHCLWSQLKEMADSGLVEVQNHSYDLHKSKGGSLGAAKRSGETAEQYRARLSEDLTRAQQRIETETGTLPTAFVYPFGAVSKETPKIVRELGFACTLTCAQQISSVSRDPESLYDLGRFVRPSGGTSKDFFEKKMGLS